MIAFACGIALGSAFGAVVMGLLWASDREQRDLPVPPARLPVRRQPDGPVKNVPRVVVGAPALMH